MVTVAVQQEEVFSERGEFGMAGPVGDEDFLPETDAKSGCPSTGVP
jgi:hypothetical protein